MAATGRKRSVVEQLLKLSDDRSPFSQVALLAGALVRGGRGDVVSKLRVPFDLACLPAMHRDLRDLLHAEQELDGSEDVAELAVMQDPDSPAARDTYRRILIKYRVRLDELLAALGGVA